MGMKPSQARCLTLLFVALLALAAPLSTAAWNNLPNYNDVYNVTNVNWTYVQGNFKAPAGYALLKLSNVISPFRISTQGYTSSLQNIGSVPYWVVSQSGNVVVLEVANETSLKAHWSLLSLFYNPIQGTNPSPLGYQSTVLNFSYPAAGLGNTQRFSVIGNIGKPGQFNFTPKYNTTNTVFLEFYAQPGVSFVLLANRSMVGRRLNISWNADLQKSYRLMTNASTSSYFMLSLGGIFYNPFVSNTPILSPNANTVFLDHVNSTKSFEAYFNYPNLIYTPVNNIAAEGMGSWGGGTNLYNASTSSVGEHNNFNLVGGLFYLTSNISKPTIYDILPAFTTNTNIVSNTITNPQSSACPVANATNYYCFQYRLAVSKIHWNYTATTFATGNSQITTPLLFNFTSGQVGYAILNFPQKSEMGVGCSSMYLRAFSNNSGVITDLGNVPYTVLNCSAGSSSTQNPEVNILIYNTTGSSQLFNSIYVYYGLQPEQGQTLTVKNNWEIANSNVIDISTVNAVYINLDNPLNTASALFDSVSATGGGNYYKFTTNAIATILTNYNINNGNSGSVADFSSYKVTTFVMGGGLVGNYRNFIISKNLATSNYSQFGATGSPQSVFNVSTKYINTFVTGHQMSNLYIDIVGSNGNAEVYDLWGNETCGISGVVCTTTASPFITPDNFPIPPTNANTTIPQTSNGINYFDTTTINWNTSNTPSNSIVIGDTGIYIPIVAIEAFAIILMFIAFATIEEDHPLATVVVMVVIWVLSVFGIQLLAIAVMASLFAIVEHYILEKNRQGRNPPTGGLSMAGV